MELLVNYTMYEEEPFRHVSMLKRFADAATALTYITNEYNSARVTLDSEGDPEFTSEEDAKQAGLPYWSLKTANHARIQQNNDFYDWEIINLEDVELVAPVAPVEKDFSVAFVATGGIVLKAESMEDAIDKAQRMLEEGNLAPFFENISENNPGALELTSAWEEK